MKLSIITINRNNATGLRKTIESVVSQTFSDFEYIVIDGASTDNSVDIIREYADKITYWVSEPDNGIYNAMNKGILKAKGEYCLFLNSGDWLVDEGVVSDFKNEIFFEDIVSGNTYLWNKKILELRKSIKPELLSFDTFIYSVMIHQSTFIKKNLFDRFGLYSENLKIVSDWEFYIKVLIQNNCTYKNFDRVVCYFDMTGISAQDEWKNIHHKERAQVLDTLLPRIHKSYFKMKLELERIQMIVDEYAFLKKGKFGWIIVLMLKIKQVKKRITFRKQ